MLTRMRLENFKSWKDTGDIEFKPITGFFGSNSSGKTSLFQALLLMKQTVDSSDHGAVFQFGDEKALVNLGDFESVIHKHDTEKILKFSLDWISKSQFVIPDDYSGGTVLQHNNIGFEIETKEESIGSGKSLILEEMAYRVADGRRFGMRRVPGRMAYDVFALGTDLDRTFRGKEAEYAGRPFKFHDFPYWAHSFFRGYKFIDELQFGLELFLRDLYYLGPLRAYPNRIYSRSSGQPSDVGQAGESVVDAILSSIEQGQVIDWDWDLSDLTLDKYIAGCLKDLGLVHDFRVEALTEGRRLFQVKVRKSPNSAEVLLTDIGLGVSQILPVLVLCFYVPRRSRPTVILEQPDIHLHPSAQAGLADIFIDAWRQRNVQILFESHSEHLLLRLQRRIAEGEIEKDEVGLFFCSTDENGVSGLSQLEIDQYGNISNWPKDFFGDQFGEIAAMSEAALERQGDSE